MQAVPSLARQASREGVGFTEHENDSSLTQRCSVQMADRGQGTEALGTSSNGNSLPPEPAKPIDQLEHRVTRVENALAPLHDTSYLEDRLVERVVHRLDDGTRNMPQASQLTVDRNRSLLPAAINFIHDSSTSSAS